MNIKKVLSGLISPSFNSGPHEVSFESALMKVKGDKKKKQNFMHKFSEN